MEQLDSRNHTAEIKLIFARQREIFDVRTLISRNGSATRKSRGTAIVFVRSAMMEYTSIRPWDMKTCSSDNQNRCRKSRVQQKQVEFYVQPSTDDDKKNINNLLEDKQFFGGKIMADAVSSTTASNPILRIYKNHQNADEDPEKMNKFADLSTSRQQNPLGPAGRTAVRFQFAHPVRPSS